MHTARHKPVRGIARHPASDGGGPSGREFRMKPKAFKTKGCRLRK
jgi:hypothetical protein